MRRRAGVVAVAAGATAATVATGYAVGHGMARRWRAGDEALVAAGLSLPDELVHHSLAVSDGGRIHAAELGAGPALVLLHGVTLGMASWANQFGRLAGRHRIVALDQRGHGRSTAGEAGFSFPRLAADVVEVLEALDVHDALVVGHSMGGMVAQTLVLEHRRRAAGRVAALALVATSARTVLGGRLGARATATLAAGGGRAFGLLARRGWGLVPQEDLATWVARASFGTRADLAQVELARSMIAAMSPVAMAELSASLLSFDVVDRLGEIDLPTQVVVGTADLLTPPKAARVLAEGIPGATLTVLAGCGHMVMLERAPELDALLEGCPLRSAVR